MKKIWVLVLAAAAAWGQSACTGSGTSSGTASWGGSSGATGVAPEFFGMHVHSPATQWQTVPVSGMRLWTTSAYWGNMSPSGPDGNYVWTNLDQWIDKLDSTNTYGMITFIGGGPGWITANPSYVCPIPSLPGSCLPPVDVNADGTGTDAHFIAFVDAFMAHLGAKDIHRRLIAIGADNEPQANYWNNNGGTNAQMARMAKDLYQHVKAVNSAMLVLSPEPSGGVSGPSTWFASYCGDASNPMQYADVIAFHNYSWPATGEPNDEDVRSLIDNMETALKSCPYTSGKERWVTEGSWGGGNWTTDGDDTRHQGWIARHHLHTLDKGVKRYYWFAWDNTGTNGLTDGMTMPNKAGVAYGQLHDWLVGAVPAGAATKGSDNTWTMPFTRSGGYQALAVWNKVADTSYSVDPKYVRYRDLDGNVWPVSGGKITASHRPVLLENGAAAMVQVTSTVLPNCTAGVSCSVNLSGSGGMSPYQWNIRSGALPAGFGLNTSTGVITGTAASAGTANFQVGLLGADGMSASANLSLTVVQQAAGGADNRYCGPGDLANFGTSDGPATLPQACVYSATAGTASNGTTYTATDCTDFGNKLSSAVAGDTIVVPSTLACVSSGGWTLPAKSGADKNHWITIRTDKSSDPGFPAEGTRATPCQVGIASLTGRPSYPCSTPTRLMPSLECSSTNCSVLTVNGSYYRLVGLEVSNAPGTKVNASLVNLSGADHVVLDRMVIHAQDNDTFSTAGEVKLGVQTNGATNIAVVDSYLYNFMCVKGGACVDSQAIAGGNGSAGGGPLKIVNNFMEASGETWIFGGGGSSATPGDLEIRRNYSFKPLTWFMAKGYSGAYAVIKNLGELKNAQRVLVEGNLFEDDWGGLQGDQDGKVFLLTPKNQSSYTSATVNTSSPDTISRVSGTAWQSDTTRVYIGGNWYTVTQFVDASTLKVTPDPGNQSGVSAGRVCEPGLAPTAIVKDVTFRNNWARHTAAGMGISTAKSDCLDEAQGVHNVSIHDNVFEDVNAQTYTNATSGCCTGGYGFKVSNDHTSPAAWPSDITIDHNTVLSSGWSGGVITGLGYVNGNTSAFQDYFKNFKFTNNVGSAPYGIFYNGTTTMNKVDVGLNVLGCPNHDGLNCTWAWSKNLVVSGVWSGQTNNAPYPSTCGTGGETCNPSSGFASVFSDFANGDYHLAAGSPYKKAATDGDDLGAHIDQVTSATQQ